MKKNLLITAFALLVSMLTFAQAPVPTSWDVENYAAIPAGWQHINVGSTGTIYGSANSCGSQALRLDEDGDALLIWVGQQPGAITFKARSTGTPWDGVFKVQESVDGNTWTAITTFSGSGAIPAATCTTVVSTPTNSLSRYIRLFYEDKVSGSNLAIDDISIAAPVLTSATLQVEQSSNAIFSGNYAASFSSAVSTPSSLNFTMKNLGTVDTLFISGITITGANASDFVLTNPASFPDSILPNGTAPLIVSFTPSASGTRTATITIATNDGVNPSYVINLYGAGDALATEPTVQASNLTFPVNKTYRVVSSFSPASAGVDEIGGYIILRRDGQAVSDFPVDGTVYERGQSIGSSKVVYSGSISGSNFSFRPNWIKANTSYHFAVFTYNGDGSITNYNTNSPLIGSVTTPASMANPTEYNSISTANATFLSDLSSLINPHQSIFYSNYTTTMINLFEVRDTFAVVGANTFRRLINCVYSGQATVFNDPFDYVAYDFSREHTYPHSWMPTFDASSPEKPEYNDQHNLYPARQSNVNATRSNYPLGEVVTPEQSFLEGKIGPDSTGKRVYEPRDVHKGRAARAIMYMAVCYNGISGNNWGLPNPISGTIAYGQNQYILKKWNDEFPPNGYDIARNDFLDSLQENRNPFVDHPEYACFIDFSNMTYIANPQTPCHRDISSINKLNSNLLFYMFPNPTTENVSLYFSSTKTENLTVEIFDISGKKVFAKNVNSVAGIQQTETINTVNFGKGIYTITLKGNTTLKTEKLILN
jgi:endonuclease I